MHSFKKGGKIQILESYLYTNSNTDCNDENGNSKFMKDAEWTVDMSENFHPKQVYGQDWQDSQNIQNVQHGHGGDYSSHKSF